MEELERLERIATRIAELSHESRPNELRRWARDTLRRISKVLDADATAAWKRGVVRDQPETMSPSLTVLNSGDAKTIIQAGLHGIAEGKAKTVASYVRKNGPFDSLDDLIAVPGIGEHTIELLKKFDMQLNKQKGGT